ncbi:type II secretion system F family protein, partial [Candidatus Pacearchaeota archaeon]|nr:type II secretion system F family protein [Candidatus Pacearchaeota archaeon]
MNTLMFYPKRIRERYIKNLSTAGMAIAPEEYNRKALLLSFLTTVISSTLFFFLDINLLFAILVFLFMNAFFYFKIGLKASDRIRQMEKVFPDVISLMASNLRAGITVDRAFVMSARKEFAPLDKEILETGKEIATGRNIVFALQGMSKRIESEKIEKVILLIISGLKAGGNISDLLGETARNMKEREVIEKKAASTILMYVIFIFFAVAAGAPTLFALSSVLVEVIISLTANIPEATASQSMPIRFSQIPITVNFVIYFSVIFIFVTDLISWFVVGLVNKG